MLDKLIKRDFTFVNYGGSYQLRIETAEDLAALEQLDEPFWMATSAPIHQLRCDAVALQHLDANKNGRIISHEVKRTQVWLFRVLKTLAGVTQRRDTLILEDIDDEDPDGKKLLVAARRVLVNLDKADSVDITLQDIRDNKGIMAKDAVNGDGVIPPESITDADLQVLIRDIMSGIGSAEGATGAGGADTARLDEFLAEAQAFLDWQQAITVAADAGDKRLLPLGPETSGAYARLAAVRDEVDTYFDLCRLVALNEGLGRATPEPTATTELFESSEKLRDYMSRSPLAKPDGSETLRFADPLNPFYREAVLALRDEVAVPLLGGDPDRTQITANEWRIVTQAFDPYREWQARKGGARVESLGTEKLEGYIKGDLPQRLRALITQDVEAGKELSALEDLEKLVLMQRWFIDVCNNFVSFPDLYDPDRNAMFEAGRLVIDGRVFDFNMRVQDVKTHSKRAESAGIFLLYSEVTAGPKEESFHIVTPVTARQRGNLAIEKRGVLFDFSGKEWDTRVVKVVENPISLSEAIAAPFKKITKLLSTAIDKISASAEKQLETGLTKSTTAVEKSVVQGMQAPTTTVPTPAPAAVAPASAPAAGGMSGARDVVLTGSLALAALGSSFAFIGSTLADLKSAQVLTIFCVGLAVVLIPVVIIAAIKLHRRNLSGILEASGWAINARMRLSTRLARRLAPAPLHPGSFTKLRKDLLKV